MCFACSAPAHQDLALFDCGWKPRLNSAQSSNSGLGCCALEELVQYSENIKAIFHKGGEISSLAIGQKFIVRKAPS